VIAHGHHQQAAHHANEASKEHMTEHGKK
jgi:hypothetical protein